MINKRGQGLSTNAIVLIILAVVVLVLLIVGFTVGWAQFAPWLSSDNVDTIVQQCGIACSTARTYEFCSVKRTLTAEGKDVAIDKTCYELAGTGYEIYDIEKCPALEGQGNCKPAAEIPEPDGGE